MTINFCLLFTCTKSPNVSQNQKYVDNERVSGECKDRTNVAEHNGNFSPDIDQSIPATGSSDLSLLASFCVKKENI